MRFPSREYMNLKLELRRQKVTQSEVADEMGISHQSLNNKLAGKTAMRVEEAKFIRDKFAPDATLDYLLETE